MKKILLLLALAVPMMSLTLTSCKKVDKEEAKELHDKIKDGEDEKLTKSDHELIADYLIEAYEYGVKVAKGVDSKKDIYEKIKDEVEDEYEYMDEFSSAINEKKLEDDKRQKLKYKELEFSYAIQKAYIKNKGYEKDEDD